MSDSIRIRTYTRVSCHGDKVSLKVINLAMGKKSTANSGKAQIKAPHDEVSNNNGKNENVSLKIAFRGAPTGEMGGAWLETCRYG